MERWFFHTRKTAFDAGSATVPVAPLGVPPNGSATRADSQGWHNTAITNAFGLRPETAGDAHAPRNATRGEHKNGDAPRGPLLRLRTVFRVGQAFLKH
jgi:hypothetical protein